MQNSTCGPVNSPCLMLIDQNPGTSQSSVSDALGIQKANFVATIADLENRGLVRRRKSDTDGRTYSLGLTSRGRSRAAACRGTAIRCTRRGSSRKSATRGVCSCSRLLERCRALPELLADQMTLDPREAIAKSPMSALQIAVVAITIGLNALDGFDVLVHQLCLARNRPRLGHRPRCLGVRAFDGTVRHGGGLDTSRRCCRQDRTAPHLARLPGRDDSGHAHGVARQGRVRPVGVAGVHGVGIGGMLAAINAVAAEFSNARRRSLNVSLMAIGYPIGAVIGGSIAAVLLKEGEWRVVFAFGAAATAAFIPLVLWWCPSRFPGCAGGNRPGALADVNRALRRMGHAPVAAMPAVRRGRAQAHGSRHFQSAIRAGHGAGDPGLFPAHHDFLLHSRNGCRKSSSTWALLPSSAAGVLVWANVGGATGGVVLGLLSLRFGLKHLTMLVLVMSTIMVAVFGHGQADLAQLSLICAIAGFFTNAGVVGLYGIFAQVFPTHVRATGTGFAIGFGRAGAWISPIIAGVFVPRRIRPGVRRHRDGCGLVGRRAGVMAVAVRARSSRRCRQPVKVSLQAGSVLAAVQPQREASRPGTNCRLGMIGARATQRLTHRSRAPRFVRGTR